jgi:hypothetical protein
MTDPTTEDLKVEQVRRERAAEERARAADEPAEARQERRRADKAAYLKDKLAERARAEERTEDRG